MASTGGSGREAQREQSERFKGLLAELEDLLDDGFFISVLGRVVVDEKRIFEILTDLRALDFDVEPLAKTPAAGPEPRVGALPENADEHIRRAYAEAQNIRRGADEYARRVLSELGEIMAKMMGSISEGTRVLDDRLEKYKGLDSNK